MLLEAKVFLENWRQDYNENWQHSSLRNVAPEVYAWLNKSGDTALI